MRMLQREMGEQAKGNVYGQCMLLANVTGSQDNEGRHTCSQASLFSMLVPSSKSGSPSSPSGE